MGCSGWAGDLHLEQQPNWGEVGRCRCRVAHDRAHGPLPGRQARGGRRAGVEVVQGRERVGVAVVVVVIPVVLVGRWLIRPRGRLIQGRNDRPASEIRIGHVCRGGGEGGRSGQPEGLASDDGDGDGVLAVDLHGTGAFAGPEHLAAAEIELDLGLIDPPRTANLRAHHPGAARREPGNPALRGIPLAAGERRRTGDGTQLRVGEQTQSRPEGGQVCGHHGSRSDTDPSTVCRPADTHPALSTGARQCDDIEARERPVRGQGPIDAGSSGAPMTAAIRARSASWASNGAS